MYIGLHIKYPLFLPDCKETCVFSTYILKIINNIKHRANNPSSGSPVAPLERIDSFCNFGNASKNYINYWYFIFLINFVLCYKHSCHYCHLLSKEVIFLCFVCVCVCMYVNYVYIHTYIHTYMHSYIHTLRTYIQGGSNMTGTDSACLPTNKSRSYLNHLVHRRGGPKITRIFFLNRIFL